MEEEDDGNTEEGQEGQLQVCVEEEEVEENAESIEALDGVRDRGRRRSPRTLRGMLLVLLFRGAFTIGLEASESERCLGSRLSRSVRERSSR